MEVFNALLPIFTEYGYLAVFAMLLVCGLGVPVPEDVTLVTGGVIAGLGYANVDTMVAVGMAGVLLGDGMVFTLGRFQGQRVMGLPGFR
jgi:membrane protein DedA with SNARE-associated domain